MSRHVWPLVLGVANAVEDQLPGVVVLEPVVDRVAVPPGLHESRQPELGEVLRHRRRGFFDGRSELADGQLAIDETPQLAQTRAVREHPKDLAGYVDLIRRGKVDLPTCIHTQIVLRESRG